MIYQVAGDILLSKAHVIAQGVCANDRMNHGLAKALHEHFPAMHKAFHQWCHQHHPKTGEIWLWDGLKDTLIANLIIQEGGYNDALTGGKTTLSHIKHALHALKKRAIKDKFRSIALPHLITSDGELEWTEVLSVIEYELAELAIPVYVYSTYIPHQRAVEPLK
jgi:O-acetyl-ADP-ribose deacetylase (regulator of RNase III)